MIKRLFCALLCAIMLWIGVCGSAESVYYGSYPNADVFMLQTRRHTCTLIAAAMMLRNRARMDTGAFHLLTEDAVSRECWTKQYGLSHDFWVEGMHVCCSEELKDAYSKKHYLIMMLKLHPEGYVIYDTGAPHAIFLFGYDETGDTFYCADTYEGRGGLAIPLAESSIRGSDQTSKIEAIDKIWYIDEAKEA